ncbi:hypothetical protein [Campylobacter sp. CCS1377]|uniref:Uncharacterized protein n=1 Tax=Campylobacter sp. CCS1377 TaxID=3158229 RepID=A0AAU7E4R2_9BACT
MTKDEIALELTKFILDAFPLKDDEDLNSREKAADDLANMYKKILEIINIKN